MAIILLKSHLLYLHITNLRVVLHLQRVLINLQLNFQDKTLSFMIRVFFRAILCCWSVFPIHISSSLHLFKCNAKGYQLSYWFLFFYCFLTLCFSFSHYFTLGNHLSLSGFTALLLLKWLQTHIYIYGSFGTRFLKY